MRFFIKIQGKVTLSYAFLCILISFLIFLLHIYTYLTSLSGSYRGSKNFGFVVNLNKSATLKMKGPGDEFELKGIEKVKIMFSNAEKHNAGFQRMYEVLREWVGYSIQ